MLTVPVWAMKMMMKKIREMKARRSGQDIGSQQVTVSDEEYPDLLKRLYGSEDFDKPKNWIGFSKSHAGCGYGKIVVATLCRQERRSDPVGEQTGAGSQGLADRKRKYI